MTSRRLIPAGLRWYGAVICVAASTHLVLAQPPVIGKAVPALAPAGAVPLNPPPTDSPRADNHGAARAEPADEASLPEGSFTVNTVHDEKIIGKIVKLDDGLLTIDADEPRTVRLADVTLMVVGKEPVFAVEWLGQDGQDRVQVGSAETGNGIQDMHLRLVNLPKDRKISQITVVGNYENPAKRRRVWRLDPKGTPHWRAAMVRDHSSTPTVADLFLEPDSANAKDQNFQVTVTLDDGKKIEAQTVAHTSTSDKLKNADKSGTTDKTSTDDSGDDTRQTLPRVEVRLEPSGVVRGGLVALLDDWITLKTNWNDAVRLPIIKTVGIRFLSKGEKDLADFERLLNEPPDHDVLLATDRQGKVVPIDGTLTHVADRKLYIRRDDASRGILLSRVVAVVLAERPSPSPEKGLVQVFRLRKGDALRGTWTSFDDDTFSVRSSWGDVLKIPPSEVREITFFNGTVVYLSDLQPVAVEEVPYFGHHTPYRRDRSFQGDVLKIGEREFRKGLALHSRCVLTYALDGQFDSFKSILGFDPSASDRGNVRCRILADDTPVYTVEELRATDEPVEIDVSVAGARQLTLEVDFGAQEDIGDRVLFADARLFRSQNKAE